MKRRLNFSLLFLKGQQLLYYNPLQIPHRLLHLFPLNNNTKIIASLSFLHIILFYRLSISLEMAPIPVQISPIQKKTLFYIHYLQIVVYNGYSAGILDFPKILYIFGNYNFTQCNQ